MAPMSSAAPTEQEDQALFLEEATNGDTLDDQQGQSSPKQKSRFRIVLTYVVLALVAFFLTLHCPGTNLWVVKDGDVASLDMEQFAELLMVVFLTFLSLYTVQGSDPGYLTKDVVSSVCQEDGLSLLGHDDDPEQSDDVQDVSLDQKQPVLDVTRRMVAVNSDGFNNSGADGSILSHDPPSDALSNNLQRSNDTSPYFQGTRRKVCQICQFAPPLRSHHCRICDKCVATFDHHCLFIGTCIGERNHCRFWWFLAAQLLGFLVCSSIVKSSSLGFATLMNDPSRDAVLVVVARVYLYPLTAIALVMWITHTVFALVNMTTFECGKSSHHIDYLRGTEETDLPFSKGLDGNLRLFCCQRDSCCDCISGVKQWTPILWKSPGKIVRDSEDWWENPWQNKYWSCC